MKSWPKLKLCKVIIWSNLVLSTIFGPRIPFWSIFSLTYLYLPLFTYIWLYLGLITLIWAYLPLIPLILPYVPYSPYAFFYWDCTSMQNCRAIRPLFMEILHFKDLGDTSVVSECSLGVNLVIDNIFDVASVTLPLYKILKQSDHYLYKWRYCILKIWGIQGSSANAVWVLICNTHAL